MKGPEGISARMRAVQMPIIPTIAEMIRRSPGTISLGQGVVHYPPPPQAINRIAAFLADPENHKYKPVIGLPELLTALETKLASENQITPNHSRSIVVSAGGNMAFQNALLAIADPGDEIILLTPYYFNHEMAIAMANCRSVLVGTDADYQPRVGAIAEAISPLTRAVVTVSPNNPTGAVYSESDLRAINALCRERGIYHITDEAYEYFTYDGAAHFSPGSIPGSEEHTISLYSLSKAYGFASWRVGYMVVPGHLLEAIRKVQDTVLICAPVISQYAAVGALEAGSRYCGAMLEGIAVVREVAWRALGELGDICSVPRTEGAFYFLLRLHCDIPDIEVAGRLIEDYKVAVLPGSTFGLTEGCYLRVAYAALLRETAEEGIGRLVRGLRGIAGASTREA